MSERRIAEGRARRRRPLDGVEQVQHFDSRLRIRAAAGVDALAHRQVDVVPPRREHAGQHARRVAELVGRRRRERVPVEEQVVADVRLDAIGDVAVHEEVFPGHDVGTQRAAEQERRGRLILRDADREAALHGDDRRHRPAAEHGAVAWHVECRRDHELVRRVEQAAAVFLIRIVVSRAGHHRVVVLQSGIARIVVALRELVVVQTAERVADLPAPQSDGALPQLDDRGVIHRVRAGRLRHVDVAELRKRPQQLAELDRLARRELSRVGDAVKRIRHERERVRHQTLIPRIDLVDVDEAVGRTGVRTGPAQILAARAGVTDAQVHVARQLALEVGGELLDARRALARIDEEDVAAGARQQPARVARRLDEAVRERIAQADRRHALRLLQQRRRGVADLAPAGRTGRRIIPRRPEHPVAAAQHGLVVDAEDHAAARRQLVVRLVALHDRRAVDAGEYESAEHLAPLAGQRIEHVHLVVQGADGRLVEVDRDLVVLLRQSGLALDAQAVVEREAVVHPPVVLRISAVVVHEAVHPRVQRDVAALRIAEQHVGDRVAAVSPGERVRARRRAVVERVDAQDAEVAAHFHAVRPGEFAQRAVQAVLVIPVRLPRRVEPGAGVARRRRRREPVRVRHLVDERRVVRPQRFRVERVRQIVVVVELVPAAAHRQHARVAEHVLVVDDERLDLAIELVAWADEAVDRVVVRVRLVRHLAQPESGERDRVVEVMFRLRRVLIRLVRQQVGHAEVRRSAVGFAVRSRHVVHDLLADRVDTAGRDDVPRERLTGQRIADHDRIAVAPQPGEIAVALGRRRHEEAVLLRLIVDV